MSAIIFKNIRTTPKSQHDSSYSIEIGAFGSAGTLATTTLISSPEITKLACLLDTFFFSCSDPGLHTQEDPGRVPGEELPGPAFSAQ
jgi:hypothetical protein